MLKYLAAAGLALILSTGFANAQTRTYQCANGQTITLGVLSPDAISSSSKDSGLVQLNKNAADPLLYSTGEFAVKVAPDQNSVTVEMRCTYQPAAAAPAPVAQPAQPLRCGANYRLLNGNCVVAQNCGANARRSPEGDCYCNTGFQMANGKCINSNVARGLEATPWKKPGCATWKAQCSAGNNRACATFESTCQVN